MIIVAGSIRVRTARRDAYLATSLPAVEAARRAPGCLDFVIAPDPIAPDRVNVYERWESAAELEAFRGSGPSDDLSADVVHADVARYEISSSGPP